MSSLEEKKKTFILRSFGIVLGRNRRKKNPFCVNFVNFKHHSIGLFFFLNLYKIIGRIQLMSLALNTFIIHIPI